MACLAVCMCGIVALWLWIAASAILIADVNEYTCSYNQILNEKGTRTTMVSSTIDPNYSNCGNKMTIINGIAQNIYSASTTPQAAVEMITMCIGDCQKAVEYCKDADSAVKAWEDGTNSIMPGGVFEMDTDCPLQMKILDTDVSGLKTCDTNLGPGMIASAAFILIYWGLFFCAICCVMGGETTMPLAACGIMGVMCCSFGLLISMAVTWGMKDDSDCEDFNKDYADDVHGWCLGILIIFIVQFLMQLSSGPAAAQQ